jgi:transposase-like protein
MNKECPECGSTDVQEFFDPDTSNNGESQYICRDCDHEWR